MSAVRPGRGTHANLHPECDSVELASKMYYPVAHRMAMGDEDLQQELMVSVLDSVGTRRISDGAKIIGRMMDQRKAYKSGYLAADKYGNSIDNGCAKRRKGVSFIPYDASAEWSIRKSLNQADLAIYFTNYRSPEETALFNIGYERFLGDLDVVERRCWDARVEGLSGQEIEKLRITRRNWQARIKRSTREKFRKWFGE